MNNQLPRPSPPLKIDRLYQPQTNDAKLLKPSIQFQSGAALCRDARQMEKVVGLP